jgi:Domain of unknown function (DUF1871)
MHSEYEAATASGMVEMARRAVMKMKKAAYQLAIQVVGSVVREWDPYSLLADGAPEDEYESGIALVVAQIPRIKTEMQAALALSRVFSSAFEAEQFTPEQCAEAGKKLYAALSANGFIDGAA